MRDSIRVSSPRLAARLIGWDDAPVLDALPTLAQLDPLFGEWAKSFPPEPADDEDKPAKFKKLGAPTGITRIGFSSKSQREKNERKEAEKDRKEHEKKMEEQTRRRKEFLMRDEIERNARAEAEREAREKERKDRDDQRKKERDMQEEAAKEENENNASSIAAQPFFFGNMRW